MAKLYNLARMTSNTTGTGSTIALTTAVSGFLSFANAGVSNGDVIDYAIKDGANSEIGTATYSSAGPQLTGRTVTKSTNSNAAINLSGTAEAFISPRAETLNDASLLTTGSLDPSRLGNMSKISGTLGADVTMTSAGTWYDGASIAQGTSGTWFVVGTISFSDTVASVFNARLWDGTTILASAATRVSVSGSGPGSLTLCGIITNPAGNLKISAKTNNNGSKIVFNFSGDSKDGTINAIRIG